MTRPVAPLMCLTVLLTAGARAADATPLAVLRPDDYRHHVAEFNAIGPEDVVTAVPDARAWDWLTANVPFFACPDPELERTYYYRWWAFRKHLVRTPKGRVITEFLRPVKHATEFNAISCAFGHHIAEGRWLRDRRYVEEYARFWLQGGPDGGLHPHYHDYSSWAAAALYDHWLATGDRVFFTSLLDRLVLDYRAWEKERLRPDGLFWQYDVRDGMESSVSGSRTAKNARPTINSYMYGNARAVAAAARLAGQASVAAEFDAKAGRLRALVREKLWDAEAQFFKPLLQGGRLADVRELMGYTPWAFDLPDAGRGYEAAWRQLTDPQGFAAPFGPTTAERRHPGFRIADRGDDCQWNGPSWPFATTVTLKALADALNAEPPRTVLGREDYFNLLDTYSRSQRLKLPDGRVVPWVDENLHPFTGEWQARAMKIKKGKFNGRGDHYNHSGFADPVITGLVGLRPRDDDLVVVNPLLPPGRWDWFCLDGVPYHGRELTVLWDRDGKRFGRGAGLRLFADGREIASAPTLQHVSGKLPPVADAPSSPPAVVRAEFVFDAKPTPSCHASTIAETPDGLVAAWFAGTRERHPDVGIWLARRGPDGWSKPVEVFNGMQPDGTRRPCWNPVLYQAPGGPLVLFFKVGPSPGAWWGMRATSADGGRTWSPAERLPDPILGPVKNKPVLLPGGTLLCGSSAEGQGKGWRVLMERTRDLGRTWEQVGPLTGPAAKAIQPTVLRYGPGRLQILCRTKDQGIAESWSADEGKTWGPLTPTALPNPNSGFDGVILRDGRALLVYNHTPRGRTTLHVAVSADGKDWRVALVLDALPGSQVSYPAVIQTADGLVHATYTHGRERIKHVVIDPAKLSPKPVAEGKGPG